MPEVSPLRGRLAGVSVPPFVLITGSEGLLAERALASVLAELRHTEPDLEAIRVAAAAYEGGVLALHASPSLFGGAKAVVVEDFDEGGEELQADVLALVAAPAPDLTLVVMHKSGQRGKKALDALKAARAQVIECPPIKTDRDKAAMGLWTSGAKV